MTSNYKIIIYPVDGIGHINACIGLAQTLQKRGNEIVFITSPMFKGQLEKYGFKEHILLSKEKSELVKKQEEEDSKSSEVKKRHPLDIMKDMLIGMKKNGILSPKSSYEKIEIFNEENPLLGKMLNGLIETNEQFEKILDEEKADLVIFDHFLVPPALNFSPKPWVFLFSGNPIFMFEGNEKLPPATSGYPSNDQTEWKKFRDRFEKITKNSFHTFQNKLNKAFGFPDEKVKHFLPWSPHLNIYGYPEELDYTDIIELPEKFARCDAFYRDVPEQFELPEEFKSKIKPGDKLVYISMGSMGSVDVDLMKKVTGALASTPHKYIVSKGPFGKTYDLPENMWGQDFLPQTRILPLVDLVITHGGNNTLCETFVHGKPMLVLPMFADQFDNGQRVTEKGFGSRLNGYACTDEELRAEVDRILNDKEILERCKKAAERMANSDSKDKLCQVIEKLIADQK